MTTPREQSLTEQLRWVHDMLRRDLITVQELADGAADGTPPRELSAGLRALQNRGPLFQLRVNCLSYCQAVGAHHHNEDTVLFPAVRRSAPQLAAAVDRLEADHLTVAALLDRISGLANDVAARQARLDLADALHELATNLLAHLEFEEAVLLPVLDSWSTPAGRMPAEIRDELARRAS
ncbi:MAG: hemerythrin domain-containing protein [Microlunatus sp.]